jgi:hypothetical protein
MTSTEKTLTPAPIAAPLAPAKTVASKKPAPKAAAKPAAAKPVAKAKAPVAKKAAASAPKKAAAVAVKPAAKTSAKPVVAKPVAPKAPKAKKPKIVRDSFTIPKPEYDVLDVLKLRAAKLGNPIKKTELIRAGVKAIAALSDAAFKQALMAVPSLKTGRPAKAKKA